MRSSCPADSRTATTCAPGRSPASRRSWARSRPSRTPAGPVIGSCNGFQILTEAGLLPGRADAQRPPRVPLRLADPSRRVVRRRRQPWLGDLADGEVIRLPISHGEGRYVADPATLDELEATGRVVLRYADADGDVTDAANPNGSERGIAGIVNERGNVLGLMPHPERASETEVGGTDGLRLFRSLERWLQARPAVAERRL